MLSCFIRKGGALGGIHSYAEAESGVESRAGLGVGSIIFLPRLIYKIGAKLPPSLSLSFLPCLLSLPLYPCSLRSLAAQARPEFTM